TVNRMKLFRSIPQSGQTLLETIIALGIIATATTATVSLLLSSMKAGTTSTNRVIAANLAREAIEAAREVRDSNWLRIQTNETGVSTFDGLFDEANPHHVRFPVFENPMSNSNFHCRIGIEEPDSYRNRGYPDGVDDYNHWYLLDVNFTRNCDPIEGMACLKNYNGIAYSEAINYQGKETQCIYKYSDAPFGMLTVPCSTVFENKDRYFLNTRYFNQLPENDNPLIDTSFKDYLSFDDCSNYRTTTIVTKCPDWKPGCDHTCAPLGMCLEVTKPTIFKRWVVLDPICRMTNASGLPDIWPGNASLEKVIETDGNTCAPGDVLVGLRVRSYVTWVDNTTTASKPHEVAFEDRLYNWKYVK
ncbi:MAG: type II secretion system protein, partial [Candidatus Kerfeldbacteria bacterium]